MAVEITILDETEVPYSCDADYGSNYDAALHKKMSTLLLSSTVQAYADIRDGNNISSLPNIVIENDDYIVTTGFNGDQYSKYRTYSQRVSVQHCRNNFVADGIGTLYSSLGGTREGDTSNGEADIAGNVPGSNDITFEKDILALCSQRNPNDVDDITFTGEAYCIKSIQCNVNSPIKRYPSSAQYPLYSRATVNMTAKKLGDDGYINDMLLAETCYVSSSADAWDDMMFMLNGKLTYYSGGTRYGDEEIVISDIYSGRLDTLFQGSEADYSDILAYMREEMPYGALMVNPWNSFFYHSMYENKWLKLPGKDYVDTYDHPDLVLSEELLSNGLISESTTKWRSSVLHQIPSYPKAFHWFIPFLSEEEYHAAMCAKTVRNSLR